ncbi:MAG: glycosyltransferase [Actinobacteria bacterium]|nr:glycosyltransferase [Actinomycetota bacterium]
MRIALVGTRGIPAAYSGFETAVEALSEEFSALGHDVTVYCRPHMTDRRSTHAGARLVHLPTIRNKHLDTIVHTALSTAHLASRRRPDVAIYFIAGNAPIVALARLAGIPTVFQIDGLDSERDKWAGAAKAYLRVAERISSRVANVCVTDSASVADAYLARFGRRIEAIPYGARLEDPGGRDWCDRLGVEPDRFILFVGRLVPENNAHLLVDAHRARASEWPLVVVGDAPYSERYIADLHARAGPEVRFPGYVFGAGYAELVHRAGIVCLPTQVGGTHPVIIESMAAGACVVVGDHAPNVEVVGDAAAVFPLAGGSSALSATLTELIADPPRRRALGERAVRRAGERYTWRPVAERYLALCESVTRRSASPA